MHTQESGFRRALRGVGLVAGLLAMSVALLVALGPADAHAAVSHVASHGIGAVSLIGFAIGQTVSYPTVSDLNKGYKRSTTVLYQTYTRTVAEYRWFDDVPDEDIMPSGRENLILLDVAIGVGAHQADDAGHESRTETPELEEGSFVFNHTNSRFAISLRAQAFDRVARGNQIIRQIKYQSLKCIEAVMRKYGYMTYGFDTGVLAKVNGNPASATTATVNLRDAFGVAGLGNAAYLSAMFPIDEGIAFIRANALVGMATVTDNDGAGNLTIAFFDASGNAATVDLADGDQIVYGNGVNGLTLGETDFNKWNVGLLQAALADDVHGVATSDVPTWAEALVDQGGGSFGFLKARKAKQALENKGDTVLRRIIVANGVQNDRDAVERQALIWTSTNMNIDGAATLKGVREDTSRFVPPTCVFGIGAD
ncbi:MAG TPA: hypothetical protein VNN79_22795, partial [Actinomycetota bacterium]|nr:hypothetical protein [Actinomycetota bacterium]